MDSDEENKLKRKYLIDICVVRHTSQKGGMVMKIEDLALPDKMKADELAELFEQHLNDFYSTKHKDLRRHEEDKRAQKMQDKQLRRYIEKGSEKYLHLRKRRFEEKVKSLNEYLSALYKDCLKMYKHATIRNFPHKTYGESKRLKSIPTYTHIIREIFPLGTEEILFRLHEGFREEKVRQHQGQGE